MAVRHPMWGRVSTELLTACTQRIVSQENHLDMHIHFMVDAAPLICSLDASQRVNEHAAFLSASHAELHCSTPWLCGWHCLLPVVLNCCCYVMELRMVHCLFSTTEAQ